MDKASVCNMALKLVGEPLYVSGTPSGEACDVFFDVLYRELLARHDWSFARRRVELKRDGEGWRVPPDCLRVVELEGLRNWRIYGGRIVEEGDVQGSGRVVCVYTSSECADTGEVPERARVFARALALELAGSLAGAVAHDRQLEVQYRGQARVALGEAMVLDTQQDNSNDQHPLVELMSHGVITRD